MLEEAQQLGFAFNEVELGNEFYVDKCEHANAFPDGATYATIANQCPFAGGKAVYMARFILDLCGDSTEYNDEEYCHSLGYRKSRPYQSPLVLLQPNPANEQTSILFSTRLDNSVILELYDLSGRLIKTVTIPENIQKFTLITSSLPEGLNNLKFTGKDFQVHSKLLIIH